MGEPSAQPQRQDATDIQHLLEGNFRFVEGVYVNEDVSDELDTKFTGAMFSEKWKENQDADDDDEVEWMKVQKTWYLSLYGYESEQQFAEFLGTRNVMLDAGCGKGYKAAWLARHNPDAIVIGSDLSDSVFAAAKRYADIPNLVFVMGDIAKTGFRAAAFDFISCDQVLHHTISPPDTLREFHRIATEDAVLNTYVYSKKGLPRELLDEHFITSHAKKEMDTKEIWELSDQLTQLGKTLSELNINITVPDMPLLNIKGGEYDLQRFIYWNFIKCYWNEQVGFDMSKECNFDWYSPSIAYRYSQEEFLAMCSDTGWKNDFLHAEEACYSGRFNK